MKTNNLPLPRIGFDRYIALDWASAALRVRAGLAEPDDLDVLLDEARLGVAARKKTRTVLNRLWLEPRPELASFAERGIALYKANPGVPTAALTWGMAIASYPFFGKVAELVGRLSALQGDCTSSEIQRRMSEIYGEREGTYRTTSRVLQTQADWNAIERVEKGKRLVRLKPLVLNEAETIAWLIEAALRYGGKSVSVAALSSLAVLYPFVLDQPLGYLASQSPNLTLHAQGPGSQVVGLRTED